MKQLRERDDRRQIIVLGGLSQAGFRPVEVVLRAFILQVKQSKLIESPRFALFGGGTQQFLGGHHVRGAPVPIQVKCSERQLGARIAFFGGLLVPLSSERRVGLDAEAAKMNIAEPEFCGRYSLLGSGGIPSARGGVIALASFAALVQVAQ